MIYHFNCEVNVFEAMVARIGESMGARNGASNRKTDNHEIRKEGRNVHFVGTWTSMASGIFNYFPQLFQLF